MEAAYDSRAAPVGLASAESLDFLSQPVDTGTTIMAVSYEGGVILGADSRVSTGVYISNRCSDKIAPVDERIYCCRSGSAADTQAVSDYVRYFLDQHRMEYGRPPKVATAASFFQRMCYANKDMLMAGMICAGWDSSKGGQVYALPIGGAVLERPYATGGSGSTYIYGFCDAHYKPGMTKEQCEQFITNAICHAMARDCSSGGVIRLVIIDEAGVERKFISGNKLPFGPL
uniref:Proteasome subunit beta n=1 Tax=Calcidiscus leptoporus TaxID=127549 RepID=A0A7S0J0L1_9EUKA